MDDIAMGEGTGKTIYDLLEEEREEEERNGDGYLYYDDVRKNRKRSHAKMVEAEDAHARLAAKTGYIEPELRRPQPATPAAPRKRPNPHRHNANPFIPSRIASIKRGGGKARSASPLTGPSTTFTPPNTFTTTPSTFSFGGGNQQQQAQPNQGFGASNGGSFTFGQQTAGAGDGMDRVESSPAPTSSSFTFGQQPQQPQQNTNGFGQQPNNPFSGFGQQNQQNGAQATPSFGGFGQQQSQNNAPSNSFTFGQQPQQAQNNNATSTSFGGFGAQDKPASPAPANPFAGFGAQPQQNGTAPSTSFTFGSQSTNGQPATNGSSTPSFGGFGASQNTQQSSQTSTNSLFAPQPSTEQKSPSPFQGGSSLFNKPAETPKADGWNAFKSASPAAATGNTPASGASVLSGWQQEQTSKPSITFSQSQMAAAHADDDDAMASPEKPAPVQPAFSGLGGTSNLFGTPQPAAVAGNDLFSRISKSNESTTAQTQQSTEAQATPKAPASSGGDLFSRMTFPDKPKEQAVSTTPAPKASNPFAGFSAAAPPATAPPKNLFASANTSSAVPATPTPATEKAPEAPATVKPAQTFSSTSLFSAATPKPAAATSLFAPKPAEQQTPAPASAATPKPTAASSLFAPKPAEQQTPATSVAKPPTTSLFSANTPKPAAEQTPAASVAKTSATSLFSSATPKPPAASSLFTPAPAKQTQSVSATTAPTPAASTSTIEATKQASNGASKMQRLNEGLLLHLSAADPNGDYSNVFRFYIKRAQEINDKEGAKSQTSTSGKSLFERAQPSQPTPATNLFARSSDADATPKPARQAGQTNGVDLTKSLFGNPPSDLQTPKPALSNGLFSKVPSTEPSKKRSLESDEAPAPMTEKRRKSKETVEYPKLGAGASDTAKLFEATLDKPADSGAAAKSLFAPKPAEQESKAGEQTPKPANVFGGFKPSTSSLFTPKPASTGSPFKPTLAADAEKPKPAAAGGFKPTFAAPAAGAANNFLSAFGANASKEQDAALKKAMDEDFDSEDDDPVEWKKQYEEKQAAKRKAIEEAAKSGGGFSFKPATGKPIAEDKEEKDEAPAETATGDNTWKQGTPIKFGADTASTPVAPLTAPPKGSGLFGSTGGSNLFANMGSKTPQPTTSGSSLFSQTQTNGAKSSFSFTSKTTEASTPAAKATETTTETTTNGDAAAEGDEEAPSDPQVEDMTALQPSEQEESDILYHVEKAKSYKFELKPNADKPEWTYKALGPVWLLKNKTTGKTRLLQKVAPLGKAGMNFNLLKAAAMYAPNGKRVTASFVDHINEKEPKKPSQWYVQFGKEDDAKELGRIMKEEAEMQ